MAQHALNQFGPGQGGGSAVDPNDLAMSGTYTASYSNTFNGDNNASNGFIGDDELFDGLASPTDHMPSQPGMHNHGQDFGIGDMSMGSYQGIYTAHHNGTGLHMDQPHMNGYSNTPDGDPIQSPFVHSYNQPQFRQLQHPQSFGNSLQSPVSYSGSPMTNSDMNNDGNEGNYLNAKPRPQLSQAMQRKTSNTRSPLTPKAAAMSGMAMGARESSGYGAQPIRTPAGHPEKSPSNQWMHTPTSLSSFPGSGFSSPMQHGMQNPQIADVLMKGGTSMPAKLNGPNGVSPQEAMKKKRRRESHNLVERRRRDNINERIQDLSRLVPPHRLEDEKIRKLIQNGTPLSPSLTGISHPTQATSGLAGPGAKRATGAGNITTGLPLEDKDKGPNKGDILNGAVSWTRDLMWMLHLKLQQQEELINTIAELGGRVPLELTEDERRMQTELMEAMTKNGPHTFSYSRCSGSGLRVPQHTDYKGDSINGSDHAIASVSPDDNELVDLGDAGQFWNDPEDDGSGPASINFKEEDEYGMDFTHD